MGDQMLKYDVDLKKLPSTGSELSDNFFRNCTFCEKFMKVTPINFDSCRNIGGSSYCPFCLRNNHHFKDNHNILIFSFRAISGYYYYRHYRCKPHKMWVAQIESQIERHIQIGLNNPVLSFDPHTLLWFANFNKIGVNTYKAPFDEVLMIMEKMFDVFEVKDRISPQARDMLWDRFSKAAKLFYNQRKRPKERKMLIPTFAQIVFPAESEEFYEQTRTFDHTKLLVK